MSWQVLWGEGSAPRQPLPSRCAGEKISCKMRENIKKHYILSKNIKKTTNPPFPPLPEADLAPQKHFSG